MEKIKKWLDEKGIQYACSEQGKNKYINIVAGKDDTLVTVRKGVYNVYTLLEKNKISKEDAVIVSSKNLEKIMETLTRRFKSIMNKVSDYNELFEKLQKACKEENICNAFGCITLAELEELNSLLHYVSDFCDNIDEEELYDYECGDKILELARLTDSLFTRDYKVRYQEEVTLADANQSASFANIEKETGTLPGQTLLCHLLCIGYDPQDYLDTLDNIETAIKDQEYLIKHPEEANEEAQYIDDDIRCWKEHLKNMIGDWKPKNESDMEKEIEIMKNWIKEMEELKK